MSEGWKLHPQILLNTSILNVPRPEAELHLHRMITVYFSSHLFPLSPCSLCPYFILSSINTLRQIWDLFSCLLTWLPCEWTLYLLQTSVSQSFGLLCIRQNKPGSVIIELYHHNQVSSGLPWHRVDQGRGSWLSDELMSVFSLLSHLLGTRIALFILMSPASHTRTAMK